MNSLLKTTVEDLTNIFDDFSSCEGLVSEFASRGYVYSEIEYKKVLFVGINPSYPEGSIAENFSFKPIDAVKKYPKHFKKFQDLADSCHIGNDWTYLDILFLRETDQSRVTQLQYEKNGLDFLCQQLQVSINLLENIKPDLIVVCNSAARTFFGIDKQKVNDVESGIWMGYEFIFDDKFGVDVIVGIHNQSVKKGSKSTMLLGTPVLFTSTLTYMDYSTKNRLVWQIRQILKYHSLFFGLTNFQVQPSITLLKQLKTLSQKIIDIHKLKERAILENRYENETRLHDRELTEIDEILRILLAMDE